MYASLLSAAVSRGDRDRCRLVARRVNPKYHLFTGSMGVCCALTSTGYLCHAYFVHECTYKKTANIKTKEPLIQGEMINWRPEIGKNAIKCYNVFTYICKFHITAATYSPWSIKVKYLIMHLRKNIEAASLSPGYGGLGFSATADNAHSDLPYLGLATTTY